MHVLQKQMETLTVSTMKLLHTKTSVEFYKDTEMVEFNYLTYVILSLQMISLSMYMPLFTEILLLSLSASPSLVSLSQILSPCKLAV